MRRTGLATLREWRELGLVPWSWVAPASGPSSRPWPRGQEAPELAGSCVGDSGPLPSVVHPSTPRWLVFCLPPFCTAFLGTAGHLHSTLWSPHLCPTPTPCSMAGGGPPAQGVPSSITCKARGLLAQAPGSHSCSVSLSSAWGPLEKHGAGPPCLEPSGEAWTRTAPGVNRSSQGAPGGCAQTCGPCPTCGNAELPQPSAPPVLGLGLSSPSTASTLGSFQGVGCACGASCVRAVGPVCCPHVHPHTCLCACVHVCVHSGVCPRVSVHVSVCVHVSVHPTGHLWDWPREAGATAGNHMGQGRVQGPGSRV